MAAVREGLPEGRYGRPAGARADRRLRITGTVLGVLAAAAVGWFGWTYVAGTDVSGSLIKFKVVSDQAVEAHIEVRKDPEATAVCTLRSQAEDGTEVGRRDVLIDRPVERVDTVVTVRTVRRGTTAELVACRPADQG